MSLVPKFYKYSCHIESETTSSTLSFSRKLNSFSTYVLTPCIVRVGLFFTVILVKRHSWVYASKWYYITEDSFLHWFLTWKTGFRYIICCIEKATVCRWFWLYLNNNFISLSFSMIRDSNLLFCEIIDWIIVHLISIWAFRDIRLS